MVVTKYRGVTNVPIKLFNRKKDEIRVSTFCENLIDFGYYISVMN